MKVLGHSKHLTGAAAVKKAEWLSSEARKLAGGPGLKPGLYRIKTYADLDALRLARSLRRNENT